MNENDRKFPFVSCHFVFDLFIREAIEQNIQSNAIPTSFLNNFFFFPSLPLREFPCEQEDFTQRLRNDAKFYGKRKRVGTFA